MLGLVPLFVDVGWLGSVTDLATFVVVTVGMYRVLQKVDTMGAGIVALAEGDLYVDDDRLASELDIEDRDVEAVRTTVVSTDGGEQDDR